MPADYGRLRIASDRPSNPTWRLDAPAVVRLGRIAGVVAKVTPTTGRALPAGVIRWIVLAQMHSASLVLASYVVVVVLTVQGLDIPMPRLVVVPVP
jgi:hypothetical protein